MKKILLKIRSILNHIAEPSGSLLRGIRQLSPMVIIGIALVCLAAADLLYSSMSSRFGGIPRLFSWWSPFMMRFGDRLSKTTQAVKQVFLGPKQDLIALSLIVLAVPAFVYWLRRIGARGRLQVITCAVFMVCLAAIAYILLQGQVWLAIITGTLAGASLFAWALEQTKQEREDRKVITYFLSLLFLAALAFVLAGLIQIVLAGAIKNAGLILYGIGLLLLVIALRQPLLSKARQFPLRPVGFALLLAVGAYIFISVLAYEDRQGHRTLSIVGGPVVILRGLGDLVWQTLEHTLAAPIPQVLAGVLGVIAILTFVYLRRSRPSSWLHDIGLALVVPALGWSALLFMGGNLGFAAVIGLLAGLCLVACGPGIPGEEPSPLLVLIPLGVGLMLRFYALAQVPNGYAEHAVVQNVEFAIPYLEGFRTAISTHDFGPFLKILSNALIREHSGTFSLVAAFGFEIFGVTLTVTRLVSAMLGTITIYVAYRVGKALDGGRLGLLFSFMIAVSPWQVTISRYGTQEHVLSPLQLLLSLLFLVMAVNGGRIRDIILAGIFISASWYVYASNLVIPLIAALFLLVRAALDPKLALRNWRKILLGLACFALLSFAPLKEFLSQGLLQPNMRTGYQGTGSIFSDYPKRLELVGVEVDQLFKHADDPWFSIPGGGIGLLQSVLLVPGLVIAAGSLRQRRHRDLALLVLLGIPIAAFPALLAPDSSFRRLMPMATLVALVGAFVVIRLEEVARATGVTRRFLTAMTWGGAVALLAAGTFGYFDRVTVGEDIHNASFRAIGERVISRLGKDYMIIVVPRRDNIRDTNRYIKLMDYDTLLDAQRRGLSPDAFYQVITCEDSLESISAPVADKPQPILILQYAVPSLDPKCGPKFIQQLEINYPRSPMLIADLSQLPADLAPAPP